MLFIFKYKKMDNIYAEQVYNIATLMMNVCGNK